MKIGIDGFSLARNDSGIEIVTKELIHGLSQNNSVEVYCYKSISLPPNSRATLKHSGYSNPGSLKKLKWELFDIARLVSPDIQIFHSPHFTLPISGISKARKIITLLDLAFLRCPEFFDFKTRMFFHLTLHKSLKSADQIICISDSAFQDTLHYFPFTKGKIHRVYLGYKDYSLIRPDNTILKDLNISSRFLLMIGTINPRKNIERAIEAFKIVSRGLDIELVIVGTLKKEYNFQTTDPRIKFTNFISDEKLAALYQNAELLLFPSFYEGFGFPILEAMSVGLPVVTSNTSSMPEVSGYPKELLCDPADIRSISSLIHKFLTNNIKFSFKEHARVNVKRFSWKKMISETLDVYEHAQKDI